MKIDPSYNEALHRLLKAADARANVAANKRLEFELGLAECIAEVTLASDDLCIGFVTIVYTGAQKGWAATYDTDAEDEWWESPRVTGMRLFTFGADHDPGVAVAQATAQAMDWMHKAGLLTPPPEAI